MLTVYMQESLGGPSEPGVSLTLVCIASVGQVFQIVSHNNVTFGQRDVIVPPVGSKWIVEINVQITLPHGHGKCLRQFPFFNPIAPCMGPGGREVLFPFSDATLCQIDGRVTETSSS